MFLARSPQCILLNEYISLTGNIVQSKVYDLVKKQNSFTVAFQTANGDIHYGQVEVYVKCFKSCPNSVLQFYCFTVKEDVDLHCT